MDKLYEVGGVGDICCCFFLKTFSTCSYTRCSQYTIGGDTIVTLDVCIQPCVHGDILPQVAVGTSQ